jgi:hypothetical protein
MRRLLARLLNLLRIIARWILNNVKPADDEIDIAVRKAFHSCGLNEAEYDLQYDLRSRRKFHEVLFIAADELGYRFVTVSDVKSLLR